MIFIHPFPAHTYIFWPSATTQHTDSDRLRRGCNILKDVYFTIRPWDIWPCSFGIINTQRGHKIYEGRNAHIWTHTRAGRQRMFIIYDHFHPYYRHIRTLWKRMLVLVRGRRFITCHCYKFWIRLTSRCAFSSSVSKLLRSRARKRLRTIKFPTTRIGR